jgi:RHS repeat-associated protein
VQSTIEYNDDMRPARMTDATGRETLYEYDEFGRVTAYTDALGRRTVLSYELEPGDKAELQRPSAIITPDGVTTQLVYDDAGRLVERIAVAPNGARTARRFVYDSVGNITSMTDEDGNTVELEYDAYGRPTSIRDAANGLATFEYNSAGFCTAVAGPDGGRTSMTYDTVGRMQSVTLPEGRTAQFEYDAADRISAVDAGDGTRVEYDHDADGNVTATSIIDSRTRESLSYSYGFNASDNLTSWSDGTVSATITYDGLGRRTGRTVDYGAFEAGYTYSFDSVGSVATFQGPGGMSHTVSADSLGRFAAMEIAGAGVVHCAGHTASGPKGLGLPGGSAQTLVYDEFGRLTGVIWRDPAGNTLFERECLLSPTGMVTVERRESGTVAYEYNAVNFLAEVDVGGDDGVTAYSYDSRGNRLTGPGWIGDATYDRESRLLTAGILEFQCDESGNCSRRTDGVHTVDYVYDPDNRLVRIDEDGETIAEYGYDPFGLRIWKEVAGVRTYYLYCDEGLLAELDATGTVLRTYGYLPSGVFGAPPLYVREGDAVYWVHSDRIGRPLRMTDTSGRVVWSAEYDAFGAAQIDVDEVTLNLRLPGQYYDAETGLHYNGLRYYDPSLGRYLQKDPLGAEGNAYAYAENNPLGQVDPTGGFSGPRMIADEYNKNLQFHGGNHLFAFFETFSPITWFCRDLQESVTGVGFRHDNKGRPLSNLERGLAMVGVATVVVPFAGKAVSLGAKGLHKGIQLGRVGVQEAGALTRNGARQQAQQMLRKETRMRTAGQFMKKGQLTEHELKELQGIAGKYGDFGISGSLAETELGLVNRTHLLSRLKMYFNKDNRWRAVKARSNLNTGKKLDLDVVIMPRESTVTKPRALQEELQKLFPGFEIDVKYSVFNQTMAAAEKWGTPMIYFKDGGYSRVAAPWQAENYWPW